MTVYSNLTTTGQVVQWEALRLGGATASPEHWSSEDQGDSGTGGGATEVALCKTAGAGGKELGRKRQAQANGKSVNLPHKLVSVLHMHVQWKNLVNAKSWKLFSL